MNIFTLFCLESSKNGIKAWNTRFFTPSSSCPQIYVTRVFSDALQRVWQSAFKRGSHYARKTLRHLPCLRRVRARLVINRSAPSSPWRTHCIIHSPVLLVSGRRKMRGIVCPLLPKPKNVIEKRERDIDKVCCTCGRCCMSVSVVTSVRRNQNVVEKRQSVCNI